jgi:hypothetical protein
MTWIAAPDKKLKNQKRLTIDTGMIWWIQRRRRRKPSCGPLLVRSPMPLPSRARHHATTPSVFLVVVLVALGCVWIAAAPVEGDVPMSGEDAEASRHKRFEELRKSIYRGEGAVLHMHSCEVDDDEEEDTDKDVDTE